MAVQHLPPENLARLRRIAQGIALTVAALCLLGLAGWLLGFPLLTRYNMRWPALSLPTATGLLLSSYTLFILAGPVRASAMRILPALIFTALIATLGLYVFAGYMLGNAEAGKLLPGVGSVAPVTSLLFFLLALFALLQLLGLGGQLAALIGAVGLLLPGFTLVMYLYNPEALYATTSFATLSLPAALCFLALFTGHLLVEPVPGWMGYIVGQSGSGHMARRMLPGVILLPVLLGWAMQMLMRDFTAFGASFGLGVMATATSAGLTAMLCINSASQSLKDIDLLQKNRGLEDRERMSRAIIESSLDPFIQIDEQGRVREWNKQAENTFGWPREEVLGKQLQDLIVPPEERSQLDAALAELRRTGRSLLDGQRLQRQALRRDGNRLLIEISLSMLTQQGGYRINYFLRDITERDTMEMQLRHAQKMEALGTLTGGLAHDFNNLLGVIIGNLDLLQETGGTNPESRRMIEEAVNAALAGSEINTRLLAFARIQPLAPKVANLNELIGSLMLILRRTLGETIQIKLNLDPTVWPVKVDASQFETALVNLASNARDAMPRGGSFTITTANRHLDQDYTNRYGELKPGDYSVVEVTDSGFGILPERMEKIFEPFYSTKPEGRGTGLGLSMVFGFMKQSGGHVNAYSEVGVGTVIRLYLPRVMTGMPESHSVLPAAAPMDLAGSETVLVVEDNKGVRDVVLRQIESFGYATLSAVNAAEALKILEQHKIDLLFTDIVMPGEYNGLELARLARQQWPEIRVVLTSGFPDARFDQEDEAARFRLLSKPYRKEELGRAFREELGQRAAAPVKSGPPAAPAPIAPASAVAAPAAEHPVASVATGSGARKILIIDDNGKLREMLRRVLDRHYSTFTASDGRDGLKIFEREKPDLVLTDILMPDQDGIEIIRTIRRSGNPVKIIAMSGSMGGSSPVNFLNYAREFGADAALSKPFRQKELIDTIRNLLGETAQA